MKKLIFALMMLVASPVSAASFLVTITGEVVEGAPDHIGQTVAARVHYRIPDRNIDFSRRSYSYWGGVIAGDGYQLSPTPVVSSTFEFGGVETNMSNAYAEITLNPTSGIFRFIVGPYDYAPQSQMGVYIYIDTPTSFTGDPLASSWELDVGAIGAAGVLGRDYVRVLSIQTRAVPEPTTWAMLLLGFGWVGALLRRHKMSHSSKMQAASA